MTVVIVIVIVLLCIPFYILYNIYIRWGTGISWWQGFVVCPKCDYKLRTDSNYDVQVVRQYYQYETKSGKPDLRYKDNSLCIDKKHLFKCHVCETKFEIEETEYGADL
jgi:uncharacterized Zn finger protein (UPF0148 family)